MLGALQLIRGGRSLWQCRRATAGLEFALVLPVMLAVYAGAIELNNFMNVYLRVNQTAFELEDLVGRQTALSDSGTSGTTSMATLCSFAAPIFRSGSSANLTNLTIKVFGATVPTSGTTTVQWEATATTTSTTVTCAKKTSGLDSLSLPAALTDPTPTPGTTSVGHIVVTVSYPYATLLPVKLLNSLKVGTSSTSIGGALSALNGASITTTVYGVPRYIVGSIPYS